MTAGFPARDPEAAEAVVLTREADDVVVMYHPARGTARDTAVLICPPFGWQEVSSYRGLRVWGRRLAADGYAAARVAYPSTGDSAGGTDDPDRLGAWSDAVVDTARWLRRHTGASRVCAIGLGLGGMLAGIAAARDAVDDLVLWATPVRGRTLVREMHVHARIVADTVPDEAEPVDRAPMLADTVTDESESSADGALTLVGYRLAAETNLALRALDLGALEFTLRPGRRALLLSRDSARLDARLTDHLRASGFAIETGDCGDYSDLIDRPQESVAPEATMALTARWLSDETGVGPGAPLGDMPVSAAGTVLRARHGATVIHETPLWLQGANGEMFGILAAPAEEMLPSRLCVVLLGAAAIPHAGPNRNWVTLAREWAADGVVTLRLDLTGIGEAANDDPGLRSNDGYYSVNRDGEVAGVLDQLQQAGIGDRFILGGLCSGAYQALRRGLVDERVAGLLLVNPYVVFWNEALLAERYRRTTLREGLRALLERARDPERRAAALRLLRPDRVWRLVRRSAERAHGDEIADAFRTLDARGVATQLLLSEREPLLYNIEQYDILPALPQWPAVQLIRVPTHDHVYRSLNAQRFVLAALTAAVHDLTARPERPAVDASIA